MAALCAEIHEQVCREAYDAEHNTFVQYYGGRAVDASSADDPRRRISSRPAIRRVRGTIEAIQRELMRDGFVMRYLTNPDVDGLPHGEGAFLACTFWLADCLVLQGRCDEARRIFERLLDLRNDVGLLSEEYDPGAWPAGRQLSAGILACGNDQHRLQPFTRVAAQSDGEELTHGDSSCDAFRVKPLALCHAVGRLVVPRSPASADAVAKFSSFPSESHR